MRDFNKYHEDNPRVYQLFCLFAEKVVNAGFKNYSAEAVFNQIRWYTDLETTGDSFKINNDYKPFYSRKWMDDHDKEGFFRTRISKADCSDENVDENGQYFIA